MLTEGILFKVPETLATGLKDGTYQRIGAIIKDQSTGQILGHVQETGLAQTALNSVTGNILSPLNTASSLASNVQIQHLTKVVEGMQILQYANIAVGIAGIGVSVVGFAMMNRRLGKIEHSISKLSQRIDQHFKELHERELRRILATIMHLFERSDVSRTLSDWKSQFVVISTELGEQTALLRHEIGYLLSADTYDEELFHLLLRPMLAADSARVELLMESDHLETAHKVAESVGENYSRLFDHMSARQLLKQLENSRYFQQSESSQNRAALSMQMQGIADGLRDITDMALTRPMMITSFAQTQMTGAEYFGLLRNEKDEPFLLLSGSK